MILWEETENSTWYCLYLVGAKLKGNDTLRGDGKYKKIS